MKKLKIGLLPLYVALYDERTPHMRPFIEKYLCDLVEKFPKEQVDLVVGDICRLEDEFAKTVNHFEEQKVDAIITVHLAYSPSLESEKVLSRTKLPIIVLDTTRDNLYDYTVAPDAVLYNHGIHGVQDMCNRLKRNGKDYVVIAGHYTESDAIKRTLDVAKAIKAASLMKDMHVGIVGEPFDGMGDFVCSETTLEKLGITVVSCDEKALEDNLKAVTDAQIENEYKKDQQKVLIENIPYENYKETERVALAVRKWIEDQKLGAFTMNFQAAGQMKGFPTMPFSEASKQLALGLGYAGEGDVLTAGIVGALNKVYGTANFVEMFCPDWQNQTVYLSHMGECNVDLMENVHMIIKDFPYAPGYDPTCIMGHMKAGKVCYINILPNQDGWFDMIFADGEMIELPEKMQNFDHAISGWFKPNTELVTFLEKFSELGGTHHSAMVYGVSAKELQAFAKALNINSFII